MSISEWMDGAPRPNRWLAGMEGLIQGIKILASLGLAAMIFLGGIVIPQMWEETAQQEDIAAGSKAVEPIYELDVSEQDNLIVLRTRREVLFRNAQTAELIHQIPAGQHVVSASRWIPETQHLLLGGAGGEVTLLDAERSWEIDFSCHRHRDEIRSMAINGEGTLAATGSSDRICLWDLKAKTLRAEVLLENGMPNALDFSPCGSRLLAGFDSGELGIFRTKDLHRQRTFRQGMIGLTQAAFIDNGNRILAGDLDGRVYALDCHTGQSVWDAHPCQLQLIGMAISPDGSLAAFSDWSNTIHLYSLKTFQKIETFIGHKRAASTLRFSKNKKWLYSGSYDGTVRTWDLQTFAELICIRGTLPDEEE